LYIGDERRQRLPRILLEILCELHDAGGAWHRFGVDILDIRKNGLNCGDIRRYKLSVIAHPGYLPRPSVMRSVRLRATGAGLHR
jgi:hypothetical protein